MLRKWNNNGYKKLYEVVIKFKFKNIAFTINLINLWDKNLWVCCNIVISLQFYSSQAWLLNSLGISLMILPFYDSKRFINLTPTRILNSLGSHDSNLVQKMYNRMVIWFYNHITTILNKFHSIYTKS